MSLTSVLDGGPVNWHCVSGVVPKRDGQRDDSLMLDWDGQHDISLVLDWSGQSNELIRSSKEGIGAVFLWVLGTSLFISFLFNSTKRGCCYRSLNLKFLVIHSIKHQVAQTRSWVLCSMFRCLRCLRCSESYQRHVSLLVGILMYLLNSLTTLTLSEKVERMRVKITKYSVH